MGQSTLNITLEDIATAALCGDGLRTRSLMQDWIAGHPDVERLPAPVSQDAWIRPLVAGLAELMEERLGQNAPPWAAAIGAAPAPTHLLRAAGHMKRLRESCEQFSPLPLRRRLFFAPANYLEAI
jgi:hypothetical protein